MDYDYINKLKIKTSDTQEMKLVFTAQSKQFFYCRDVVCEYVMRQGFLPINPFRVFDYFLGDRVDRNLVRRGNNQLIRTCDELWVFGSIADGVLFEIVSAIEQKKPVRFFTIGSEMKEIHEISVDDITFEPQVHAAKIRKQDIIDFIKTGDVKRDEQLTGQITMFAAQHDRLDNQLFEKSAPGTLQGTESLEETPSVKKYDVVVIGLGPSGMMALKYLADNLVNAIGIDMGKNPYERTRMPNDIPIGFGGAGLFSDGKLSFYPSGSRLWSHLPKDALKKSYEIIKGVLSVYGCQTPDWSSDWNKESSYDDGPIEKSYDSIYFSRKQSDDLIQAIYENYREHILLNTKVSSIIKKSDGYQLITTSGAIYAKRLVVATGKLGNGLIAGIDDEVSFKTRYEGGFRLETDSRNFRPSDSEKIDFKLIERLNEHEEIRTFCCCKDGIVVESFYGSPNEMIDDTRCNGFTSFNGSLAEHTTGRSNIGITIRTENEDSEYCKEFISALRTTSKRVLTLREMLDMFDNGDYIIGSITDEVLIRYIRKIIESECDSFNTLIYWPEIEYYGKYPLFNWETLKLKNNDIWVIGDVTGEFRGLIPSMVSGVLAAQNICQEIS